MLELRPTCENCNKPLPPNAADARICTYECTFCAACVETCSVTFAPTAAAASFRGRSGPRRNWKGDNFLGKDPASTKLRHRPVDPAAHARFAAALEEHPAARTLARSHCPARRAS